jgi:cysteine-rich repeat protein
MGAVTDRARLVLAITFAIGGGCAQGEGHDGPGDGGMLGGDEGSGTSSTGRAETEAGSDTTATSAGTGGAETSGENSTESGPECGNGIVELGEECDDGNDSNLDECTNDCKVPTCTDGIHSGAESDVDCGGPCKACEVCNMCFDDEDCRPESACNEASICTWSMRITIDWLHDCSTDGSNDFTIADVPPGPYLATAVPSAGTVWDPPWNPPTNGWAYRVTCTDIDLPNMRTPAGTYYADAEEAFANLMVESETFEFRGGDLRCGRPDSNCDDNHGEVIFDVESYCPTD